MTIDKRERSFRFHQLSRAAGSASGDPVAAFARMLCSARRSPGVSVLCGRWPRKALEERKEILATDKNNRETRVNQLSCSFMKVMIIVTVPILKAQHFWTAFRLV